MATTEQLPVPPSPTARIFSTQGLDGRTPPASTRELNYAEDVNRTLKCLMLLVASAALSFGDPIVRIRIKKRGAGPNSLRRQNLVMLGPS
jgi:hypothetical protein